MGSHRRAARVLGVLLWGLAAGHVLEALWLRRRREHIPVLPAADDKTAGKGIAAVVVTGGEIDTETLAAAATEMEATGLQVIDLVPADLPPDRAVRLLRWVDATWFARDPAYAPGGAHEAVVIHESVANRMGLGAAPTSDGEPPVPLGRSAMVQVTVKAQRHAALRSGIRVAPRCLATPQQPKDRWQEWETLTVGGKTLLAATPLLATMETVHLLAMTAGLALAPVPALAALITWSAQPRLVFGGRYQKPPGKPETAAWRPPEVGLACLSRLPSSWARNIGTLLAGFGDFRAREADRAQTPVPQPPPAEELFEPRRHTCPWCDSRCIVGRLDTTDLFLQRPGRFHLDWCTDCGHIFQNPAMSAKGLDHYYDQFYNGMGKELWVGTSAGPAEREDSHLDTMERLCRPRSWLDVGTGHGHFGLMVRQRWPDIVIDGLDMGDAVVEAQRRGWIDTAYVGLFPELANGLPRTYDVVSMHHYLEHTRDPRREITAAFEVLEPGGYLEIEVPNAESPWAQRLGRYWGPWLQPQHLHFVPRDNLTAALRENGFEIVVTERGSSPIGLELSPAGILVLQAFTRNPHLPWLPAPSLTDRAKRIAGIATVLPLMAVTAAIEAIVQARLGPDEVGSAYRVVARKP